MDTTIHMPVPAFLGLPSLYFTICFHCTIVPIIATCTYIHVHICATWTQEFGRAATPKALSVAHHGSMKHMYMYL